MLRYLIGVTENPTTPQPAPPVPDYGELEQRYRRQKKRVARFRVGVLFVTAVLVAGLLVIILLWRVPLPQPANQPGLAIRGGPDIRQEQLSGSPGPVPGLARPVNSTVGLIVAFESTAADLEQRWSGLQTFLEDGRSALVTPPESDTAGAARLASFRSAVMGETTLAGVARLYDIASQLQTVASSVPLGQGNVIRPIAALMKAYAADYQRVAMLRREYLVAALRSAEALARADTAEADIAANVANGRLALIATASRQLTQRMEEVVRFRRRLTGAE